MCRPIIATAVLTALLLGYPTVTPAQDAKQPPQQSGAGPLAQPEHQQQADDAMHTAPGRAGTDEPASHAQTKDEPVLVNGALNVAGAPKDSQTVPAKYSERNDALDKLPTMAFPIALTDDQKHAILDGVDKDGAPVAQIDAAVTAELPLAVTLNDLPQAGADLPTMTGLKYVRLADRILLVQAANRVVVGAIGK
jgi:hypothetical protein